jgi:hypothetical protein
MPFRRQLLRHEAAIQKCIRSLGTEQTSINLQNEDEVTSRIGECGRYMTKIMKEKVTYLSLNADDLP